MYVDVCPCIYVYVSNHGILRMGWIEWDEIVNTAQHSTAQHIIHTVSRTFSGDAAISICVVMVGILTDFSSLLKKKQQVVFSVLPKRIKLVESILFQVDLWSGWNILVQTTKVLYTQRPEEETIKLVCQLS